jgi:hypothetical protein
MKKIKFKDSLAHILDVNNSIDNSGYLETMKKPIKMFTSFVVHSKDVIRSIIQDQI